MCSFECGIRETDDNSFRFRTVFYTFQKTISPSIDSTPARNTQKCTISFRACPASRFGFCNRRRPRTTFSFPSPSLSFSTHTCPTRFSSSYDIFSSLPPPCLSSLFCHEVSPASRTAPPCVLSTKSRKHCKTRGPTATTCISSRWNDIDQAGV